MEARLFFWWFSPFAVLGLIVHAFRCAFGRKSHFERVKARLDDAEVPVVSR
jgi:hypothetical protein